jgi:menaquinone-dependent protoporphyrinogen oxidase
MQEKTMEKKVLLAYATTHGSTEEIAQQIASILVQDGVHAEILPASSVRSLTGFSGVILGGPQYMFRWHRDAMRFLTRFRKNIENGLPVAVFVGGPIEVGSDEDKQIIRDRFTQELETVGWFKPVSVLFVGGKFDPTKLRFPYNLIPALKNMPAVDFRDWAEIKGWAKSMPAKFHDKFREAVS